MRRGLERYGVVLDAEKRAEVVRQIRDGEGVFVERWSTARSIWRVTIDEQDLVVVYDKRRGEIATVLHPTDPRCGIQLSKEEKEEIVTKIDAGAARIDSVTDDGRSTICRVHIEPKGWLTVVYAQEVGKIRVARECHDHEVADLEVGT
jgi:hypothetical protein